MTILKIDSSITGEASVSASLPWRPSRSFASRTLASK